MARKYAFQPLAIDPEHIKELDLAIEVQLPLEDVRELLKKHLTNALELEFTTIPPYLCAAFSLDAIKNKDIRMLIVRIAKEEMLHMTVAANLMNAVGITPEVKDSMPQFYPDGCRLKMISNSPVLNLESFSIGTDADPGTVRKFMAIEAPEIPLRYKTVPRAFGVEALEEEKPKTIGEFYERIIAIVLKYPDLFKDQDPAKQLSFSINFKSVQVERPPKPPSTYPLKEKIKLSNGDEVEFNFKITNSLEAEAYLKWVIEEGEGTSTEPMDSEGLAAHYYRFESILKDYYLVEDKEAHGGGGYDGGYTFSGANLTFDPSGAHEFDVNPTASQYNGTPLKPVVDNFVYSYMDMIDALDKAFKVPAESQQQFILAVAAMNSMVVNAGDVINKAKEEGLKGGLPFEYM